MAHPRLSHLADGRLHLNHGPIDLVIGASGPASEIEAAHERCWARFQNILDPLVAELARLRAPLDGAPFVCSVARRMAAAVAPHGEHFITPMAAVAGAVADEICAALTGDPSALSKAYVNNGGDIAFHLAPGAVFELGLIADVAAPVPTGKATITADQAIRGVATSGRSGRSLSLGIADAVTALAADAAAADAAATLIANAVDLPGHEAVRRRPANELDPDSDLRARLVTVDLGALSDRDIAAALEAGARRAEDYLARGLIAGAALALRGEVITIGLQ